MKKLIIFITTILLSSCTSNTIYKKPKTLIPKDTMVLLLEDLFIASSSSFEKNKKLERKINYMPLVYDKYGIDSLRFIENNLYYISKVDEYDELYKQVKSNLTVKKDELERQLKEQDSLSKKTPKLTKENYKIDELIFK